MENKTETARFKVETDFNNFLKKFDCKSYPFLDKFILTKKFDANAIEIKVYFSEVSFEIVNRIKSDKLLYSYIIPNSTNKEISIEQLFWFLSNNEVQNYLKIHISGGAFIPRLRLQAFEKLNIPVSKVSILKRNEYEVDLVLFNSYKLLLSKYFEEYNKCFKIKNYIACTSLSGSICELILYQLLIEQNTIAKSFLNEKGLGSLIIYSKMLELEKKYKFDISVFEKINNIRNKIIHPSNTINEDVEKIEELINPIELNKFLKKILITFGIN